MSTEKPITVRELDEKLDRQLMKYPTKWEVRFLIAAGLVANQFVPADEVAKAAVGFFT
jgi:hypothetical protein